MHLMKIIGHRAHREHRGKVLCALKCPLWQNRKTDCTDKKRKSILSGGYYILQCLMESYNFNYCDSIENIGR